jgi:hypothetical protein
MMPFRIASPLSPLFALALGLFTSACGVPDDSNGPEGSACIVGAVQLRTELFFGLDRANAEPVTDAEFQSFVDTVITPLFREGLTTYDARGQYLMDTGELVHENSKVVMLIHDGSAARSADINSIREQYKQRFAQEAVLRIDSVPCIAFD